MEHFDALLGQGRALFDRRQPRVFQRNGGTPKP